MYSEEMCTYLNKSKTIFVIENPGNGFRFVLLISLY